MQYNTIQYNTMQCNAMQCNLIHTNPFKSTIQYEYIYTLFTDWEIRIETNLACRRPCIKYRGQTFTLYGSTKTGK